jgi:hypothetical protein
MAMENLAIAQHWDTLCYVTTRGGGYQLKILGNYVYLQQTTLTTLDVTIGHVILSFTFRSVVVGELRWSNMEGPCAQLCTMSFSQCGWPNGHILSHGSY